MNGSIRVDIERKDNEDVLSVHLDHVGAGDIVRAMSELVLLVSARIEAPIDDVLASIYNTCLTPEQLEKVQAEVDEGNAAIDEFNEAMTQRNDTDTI